MANSGRIVQVVNCEAKLVRDETRFVILELDLVEHMREQLSSFAHFSDNVVVEAIPEGFDKPE